MVLCSKNRFAETKTLFLLLDLEIKCLLLTFDFYTHARTRVSVSALFLKGGLIPKATSCYVPVILNWASALNQFNIFVQSPAWFFSGSQELVIFLGQSAMGYWNPVPEI